VDEPAALEVLQGGADGGARHPVFLHQAQLSGQAVTRLEVTAADAVPEVVGDLLGEGEGGAR
jgi:hypothetical protein